MIFAGKMSQATFINVFTLVSLLQNYALTFDWKKKIILCEFRNVRVRVDGWLCVCVLRTFIHTYKSHTNRCFPCNQLLSFLYLNDKVYKIFETYTLHYTVNMESFNVQVNFFMALVSHEKCFSFYNVAFYFWRKHVI